MEASEKDLKSFKKELKEQILKLNEKEAMIKRLKNVNDMIDINSRDLKSELNEITKNNAILIKEKDELFDQLSKHKTELNEIKMKTANLIKEKEALFDQTFESTDRKINEMKTELNKLKTKNKILAKQKDELFDQLLRQKNDNNIEGQNFENRQEKIFLQNVKISKLPCKPRNTVVAHETEGVNLSYNSQGNIIVTSGGDKSLKIWDSNSTTEKLRILGLNSPALSISIDKFSNFILTGCTDKNGYIFCNKKRKIIHTLAGHADKIVSTKFFHDKKEAVTGSNDGTLKI